MSDTESVASGEEPNIDASYAAPLGRWERAAASGFGVVLTGVGVASVFLGKGDAGSVTLVLGGVAFLIVAVIGMSLHRVR
ncbi:hypothetical protein [Streptomyces sedi]|uniref:Uncharacterized protein n=1 Tax=Streptomyces sedi TaxID=555059 RepID=A0A5C4UPP1_9ACTN|nr:hypothetical protein [Streptomyces sedi]TNM25193.1 hypothetical protein FH715_26790 [Streptomyces sedi]